MIDWNDIRNLVAVADEGSTLAASRTLRVSQTTVARRLAALEQATGLTLFDRSQGGYRVTPSGAALLDEGRQMASSGLRFEQAAMTEARATGGTIRLTTEDIFANTILAPMIGALTGAHPAIRIELDATSEVRDLGAGEAEIALRATSDIAPAGVVGRRVCRNAWTLYCSRDYAETHGLPRSRADLKDHAIVGGGGGSLWRYYREFLERNGLQGQVAVHQATSTGLLTGVRAGIGVGVLPCIVSDGEADLVRCLPATEESGRDMMLVTHERVRHQPAVRAAIDFLYERLRARAEALGLA